MTSIVSHIATAVWLKEWGSLLTAVVFSILTFHLEVTIYQSWPPWASPNCCWCVKRRYFVLIIFSILFIESQLLLHFYTSQISSLHTLWCMTAYQLRLILTGHHVPEMLKDHYCEVLDTRSDDSYLVPLCIYNPIVEVIVNYVCGFHRKSIRENRQSYCSEDNR